MTNRLSLFLWLFATSCILTIGACLSFVLWKLGWGERMFLAAVICTITGAAALLFAVSRLETGKTNKSNQRIGVLLYTELVLAAAGILFFALWKTGIGEWAMSVSAIFMAFVMFGPPVWFIIQPDLAITTFNALTGNVNAPDDWKTLSSIRRGIVSAGTLLLLVIGILLLVVAIRQLLQA
jgi:hypothetical protein